MLFANALLDRSRERERAGQFYDTTLSTDAQVSSVSSFHKDFL
jgi:hypothetical protein